MVRRNMKCACVMTGGIVSRSLREFDLGSDRVAQDLPCRSSLERASRTTGDSQLVLTIASHQHTRIAATSAAGTKTMNGAHLLTLLASVGALTLNDAPNALHSLGVHIVPFLISTLVDYIDPPSYHLLARALWVS